MSFRPRHRLPLPSLEPLEDRTVPAVVSYVADGPVGLQAGTTTSSPIPIQDDIAIQDLEVRVDIQAPDLPHLTAFLVSPDGTRVQLIADGASGTELFHTRFDDEATQSLAGSTGNHTGHFVPAQSLSAFDGKSLRGTWNLEVAEANPRAAGSIDSWSLIPTVAISPRSYVSGNVPIDLAPHDSVSSTIQVTDSFRVGDIQVSVDLTHTPVSDLLLTLHSPDGRSVALFNMTGDNGSDFHGTVFDDHAGSSIVTATAPFTGHFQPMEPLSGLLFDSAFGTWTLSIQNDGNGDPGTLDAWSLSLSPQFADPLPDLVSTSFSIGSTQAFWGDTVNVHYALANVGAVPNDPTTVAIVASSDAGIDSNDLVLARVPVDQIFGPGQPQSVAVMLPGSPTNPPPGFAASGQIYLGLRIDPDGALIESNVDNNSNLGIGIDEQPFTISDTPSSIHGSVRDTGTVGLAGIRVYLDSNQNGSYDPGERYSLTDSQGSYSFENLEPGTYRVMVVNPAGDTITAPTPVPDQPIYHADFSQGDQGYTSSGTNGQWTLSNARGRSSFLFGDAVQGYPNNANVTLTSPTIYLSGVTGARYSFDYFLNAEDGVDLATVGVIANGVETILADNGTRIGGIVNTPDGFHHVGFDLSRFSGHTVQLFFRFTSGPTSFGEGWYVADPTLTVIGGQRQLVTVGVGETVNGVDFSLNRPADLIGTAFTLDRPMAAWGDSVTVNYSVTNAGGTAVGPFQVDLRLSSDRTFDATDFLLGSVGINGLAAGETYHGTTTVILPGSSTLPPMGFLGQSRLFIGAVIDPGNAVVELNKTNNSGRGVDRDLAALTVVPVTTETEPSDTLAKAESISTPSIVVGNLPRSNDRDLVRFTLTDGSRLVSSIQTNGSGLDPSLQLLDGSGNVLVESRHASATDPSPLIDLHLIPGTYFLAVRSAATSTGLYRLLVDATPSTNPLERLGPGLAATSITPTDLNGDGIVDFLAGTIGGFFTPTTSSSLLGIGDGGLAAPIPLDPQTASASVVADLNGDGIVDLAGISSGSGTNSIWVRLGNGDGTFQAPITIPTVGLLSHLAAGDLDGDGRVDLVGSNSNSIEVFLGNGDGTFRTPTVTPVDRDLRTGFQLVDLNGDGKLDLAFDGTLTTEPNAPVLGAVYLGNGDGTFRAPVTLSNDDTVLVGRIRYADLNGDGKLDLIVQDQIKAGIAIRFGDGSGNFLNSPLQVIGGSVRFSNFVVGDFNGDGKLDLAGSLSDDLGGVGVFLNNGDGTFGAMTRYAPGSRTFNLATADLDHDGHLDLFGTDVSGSGASILYGNGDGTFRSQGDESLLPGAPGVQVADLNGDGIPDLVAGNGGTFTPTTFGLRIALGNGDGTFRDTYTLSPGTSPADVRIADLDRDGRLDIVAEDAAHGGIIVYLGNGDGTFRAPTTFAVGHYYQSLIVGDFNGDGIPDLAVQEREPSLVGGVTAGEGINVFLGRGDGTFAPPIVSDRGLNLTQFAVGDLNGDGRLDLVGTMSGFSTGNSGVAIMLGRGDGSFAPATVLNPEYKFNDPTLADLDGDGKLDLVVGPQLVFGNGNAPGVGIYYGHGDGTFDAPVFPTASLPSESQLKEPVVGDFNHDGRLDIVGTTSSTTESHNLIFDTQSFTTILPGAGGRTFGPPISSTSPGRIVEPIAADFNGDGNLDIVGDGVLSNLTTVVGDGNGHFSPTPRRTAISRRAVPQMADLYGDGKNDILIVDARGEILLRRALPGVNLFAPAIVVNPGHPAIEATFIRTASGVKIAASNRGGGLTIYQLVNGKFVATSVPQALETAARLRSADLNGDGLDDLIDADPTKSMLTIYFQRPDGTFSSPTVRSLGTGTNGIIFGDIDGKNGLDILTVNRSSGDVSVLKNDPDHTFADTTRYRASLSPVGTESILGLTDPVSTEEPIGVGFGDFTGDGIPDIVTVDRASRRIIVLPGDGRGGFGNPTEALSTPLGDGVSPNADPGQLIVGDFDHDGKLDLAIIAEGTNQVLIYRGMGNGKFALRQIVAAGNAPTGISLAQLNDDDGDGVVDAQDNPDLLIGNGFGDVLTLLGNGDGTFRNFVRTDQRVPLAVIDSAAGLPTSIVVAQQARDSASTSVRQPGTNGFVPGAFRIDGNNGLIGPGDVQVADVTGNGLRDLIFANTGSNNILIYLQRPDGSFDPSPLSFFAGTSPSAIKVADVNGDGIPDLIVANEGSNDVSILYGSRGVDVNGDGKIDGEDLFRVGPRLNSGGQGPNAVTIMDVNGDGVPDILATNGLSGTLSTLLGLGSAGVGNGSFDPNAKSIALSSTGIVGTSIIGGMGAVESSDGIVELFNPITGAILNTLNTSGNVADLQMIQFGGQELLFTVNRDGTGGVFSVGGGTFNAMSRFQTAVSDPGDLKVFAMGDNQFEVILTDSSLGSPRVIDLDLSPTTPIMPPTGGGNSTAGGPPTPINPFNPPQIVNTTLDNVTPTGSQFALVVTLVTSLGRENVNLSVEASNLGIDPFGSEGSAFADLAALAVSQEGTVVSAGALALASIDAPQDEEVIEEFPFPNRPSVKQFIGGVEEEIEKFGGRPMSIRPAIPAPPIQVNPPTVPADEPARFDQIARRSDPVEIVAPDESSEIELQPAASEDRAEYPTGPSALTAALTLTGVFLGGQMVGLWYRPENELPGLKTELKKRSRV